MSQPTETIIYPERGLEYATVAEFRPRNGWGIAKTADGEVVHFHTSRCRPFVIRNAEPVFSHERKQASPSLGVTLCFLRLDKSVDPQAKQEMHVWNFPSCFEQCKRDCRSPRNPADKKATATTPNAKGSTGERHRLTSTNRRPVRRCRNPHREIHSHDQVHWWNRPEAFLDPRRPTPQINLLAEVGDL